MSLIAVIDFGMGNLRSVAKALEHVAPKHRVVVTSDSATIDSADRVVLPGQGAMPDCMRHLREFGLVDAVRRAAATRPLLGVCVGEQMLLDESDEAPVGSVTECLGLIPGRIIRFPQDALRLPDGRRLKVPHMGWNQVRQTAAHKMWRGIDNGANFYFVHSFFAKPSDSSHSVGESDYGVPFTCAVARDNIFATQFHPEKSAALGLKLYENFIHWNP
jgi:glutamine amidotransferase